MCTEAYTFFHATERGSMYFFHERKQPRLFIFGLVFYAAYNTIVWLKLLFFVYSFTHCMNILKPVSLRMVEEKLL